MDIKELMADPRVQTLLAELAPAFPVLARMAKDMAEQVLAGLTNGGAERLNAIAELIRNATPEERRDIEGKFIVAADAVNTSQIETTATLKDIGLKVLLGLGTAAFAAL